MPLAVKQYQLVKDSRKILLDYCETLTSEDFLRENTPFGKESVRNLLVHNANCYIFWIGNTALQLGNSYAQKENHPTLASVRELYVEIDMFMNQFLVIPLPESIPFSLRDTAGTATGLQLFTHVITHEFHHKGQILSLSRQLGYVPVDTDIMR